MTLKFKATVDVTFDEQKLIDVVDNAGRLGMRDVTVEVAAETVENSPWLTGNNRRSMGGRCI